MQKVKNFVNEHFQSVIRNWNFPEKVKISKVSKYLRKFIKRFF